MLEGTTELRLAQLRRTLHGCVVPPASPPFFARWLTHHQRGPPVGWARGHRRRCAGVHDDVPRLESNHGQRLRRGRLATLSLDARRRTTLVPAAPEHTSASAATKSGASATTASSAHPWATSTLPTIGGRSDGEGSQHEQQRASPRRHGYQLFLSLRYSHERSRRHDVAFSRKPNRGAVADESAGSCWIRIHGRFGRSGGGAGVHELCSGGGGTVAMQTVGPLDCTRHSWRKPGRRYGQCDRRTRLEDAGWVADWRAHFRLPAAKSAGI